MNPSERNILRLRHVLTALSDLFAWIGRVIGKYTANDRQWIIIILLLSALVRIPLLNHPDRTLFDEVIYTNFATHIVNQTPFFDIHPPLARMIFAGVAQNSHFELWGLPMETNKQFGDFPYVTLRLFIAFFGTLLPLLLYLIGRLIYYAPKEAGILALFAVFDNALVLYSRSILPDTLLLFFGFLGFSMALAATRTTRGKSALVFLSGITLGLAFAIKWTALAMIALVAIVYFFKRMHKAIVMTVLLVMSTYFFVFTLYFTNFPHGGHVDPLLYPYNKPWIANMTFPDGTHLEDIVSYLPQMHEAMMRANSDPDIAKVTLQSAGPLSWPAARSSLTFWLSDDGKETVILRGNEFLWFLTFFMILFEIGWIAVQIPKKKKWPINNTETILFLGYIFNYTPFFLIHRPMYLYHYFTAFIFLLLLVPRVMPRIITCIADVTHDKALARTIMYFSIFLVLVNFLLLMPTTYGF